MNIVLEQISNEITNTIRVCINDSAIIDLTNQKEMDGGYFVTYNNKIVSISEEEYKKVMNGLVDKRDFNTSPFDYHEDYFLTNIGFSKNDFNFDHFSGA